MTPDRAREAARICDAALDRPASEWEAFIGGECAGDEALRREVESLLRQQSKADEFLRRPALEVAVAQLVERHALLVGQQVGPYLIQGLLGAGGMGEVYRAHDTKLGRDVAIKILPRLFTSDPERLARFEREARVLASLNHPHIGAIYGLENADGVRALVLELVDGETLADRIARGALPLKDALAIARQIADALDAAHEKGIVHRDLKPANIRITGAGLVKVLDFGLAKVARPVPDGSPGQGPSVAPTLTVDETEAGVILGTVAYMSPEQARGQVVDKRTDIWAFGCVLYEMLAGRSVFAGTTVTDMLVAILEREPAWAALPDVTPPSVRRLLRRCLEKDPKQRLRDIGDAQPELKGSRRSVLSVATAAAAVVAVLGIIGVVLARRDITSSPMTTEPPLQLTDFTDSAVMPSLSHDGRMLTFVRGADFGRTAPKGEVYVKLLPNGDPVQLTRDQSGGYPTFNPDDSRIVFTTTTPGLKWDSWEVPVLGGSPQPFLPNASGLTWLDSQRLVYSFIRSGLHMGIVTSNLSRTESREIYFPSSDGGMAHRSAPSPDGAWLLVVEMERGTWQPCRLVPMDGSSSGRTVGPGRGQCTSAAWSPNGRWMYFSSNAGGAFHIWRQRYPDGAPEPITFGPTQQEGTAITPDGQYLITSMGLARAAIWLHDASGSRQLTDTGYAIKPVMAPSGGRLYYLIRTEASQMQSSGELWVMDVNSGSRQRLFPGLVMTNFELSQDGRQVLFTSSGQSGGDGVWIADLERRSPPKRLTRNGEPRAFFGAAGEIIYMSGDGLVYRMREDGSGTELTSPERVVYLMTVSPDGRWAAVIRPERGDGGGTSAEFRSLRGERSVAVCNEKCGLGPASVREGLLPFDWSLDGKWLLVHLYHFQTNSHRSVVLPYRSGVPLERLWPKGLKFEKDVEANPGARIIDDEGAFPTSDGSAYLTVRPSFQSNLYRVRIPN